MIQSQTVHIIGAGWSGLACAVKLAQAGIPVQLLEAAPQAGGRARSVHYTTFPQTTLDNGQHIMLGAYQHTLDLFKQLGINEQTVLHRQPLSLHLYSRQSPEIILQTSKLPAPLHLIQALLNFKHIAWKDRTRVILMLIQLSIKRFRLPRDISVYDLLSRYKQSRQIIQALWEPLCLATMNTPVKEASAQVFLNVLDKSFNGSTRDSDLLFFKTDLSRAFCDTALDYIKHRQGTILYKHRVIEIEPTQDQSSAPFIIHTRNSTVPAHTIVLATPPYITQQLQMHKQNTVFKPLPENSSLNFGYQPICTVYIQYPEQVQFKQVMSGFFGTLSQWAIDHSLNKQAGLIAVVISSTGRHLELNHEELVTTLHEELKLACKDLPSWLHYQVVTEKKATFSCRVNINQTRPDFKTSRQNLYLAGDYTRTGYPATLEGAVISGFQTARHIIKQRKR